MTTRWCAHDRSGPTGARWSSRGVTLIESLVAVVILSLGVLAVVALQLVARRNNADAAQRSVAAQLAYDIVERMRSNSTAEALRGYLTGTASVGRGALGAEPAPGCKTATPCSGPQLAAHDLWHWEQAIDGAAETAGGGATGGLALPTACITGPAAGGDGVYTVTIAWRGRVAMPDNPDVACGRDPQPDGSDLYSRAAGDNVHRRTLTLPVYITARRRGGA